MINIQNIDDNECVNWCLVRHLNPADLNPARITKADKDFNETLILKDIKFLVKIRDIRKVEKKIPLTLGHENKEKHPIYVSKKFYKLILQKKS